MLAKLIANIKLLTVTYQEIRMAECRQLFMQWKLPDWPDAQFNYHKHNVDFVRWLEHHPPDCINWFQAGHYGLWE